MPCARVPGTKLSTPVAAPGRPPAAATLISPGGNLTQSQTKSDQVKFNLITNEAISVNSPLTCRRLHLVLGEQ